MSAPAVPSCNEPVDRRVFPRSTRDRVGIARRTPRAPDRRRPPSPHRIKPASWSYAEAFVAEDDVLAAARARAEEVGVVADRLRRRRGAALPRLGARRPGGRRDRHRHRRLRPLAAARHARRRRPDHRRHRGRAPAAGQGDLRRGRHPLAAGPDHLRRRARRAPPADRRPLRPGLLRRRQGASTAPTSPRRCGCCAPAAWWPSTTRCGTTGSPTRPSATRRPSRSASSAAASPTNEEPGAGAAARRRRPAGRQEGVGPRGRATDAASGAAAWRWKPSRPSAIGDDVALLDQDRRAADDLRARRLRGALRRRSPGTPRAPRRWRRRSSPRTTRPAASARS